MENIDSLPTAASTKKFIEDTEAEIEKTDDPLVKAALQDQIDQLKKLKGV